MRKLQKIYYKKIITLCKQGEADKRNRLVVISEHGGFIGEKIGKIVVVNITVANKSNKSAPK